MTAKYALPSTWLVVKDDGTIVAAYRSLKRATTRFTGDTNVSLRRAPDYLADRNFVWSVVNPENQLDGQYGGNAEAATERASEIGGELRLFLADE